MYLHVFRIGDLHIDRYVAVQALILPEKFGGAR